MGHSQAEKARSRDRILAQAAAQIREDGLESVSVSKLMQAAGLTHGGFYGHFASRAQLLNEALDQALSDGTASFRASSSTETPSYDAIVRSYLSRRHRDSRAEGCAIAALAGDVTRAQEDAREAMTEHVCAFAAQLRPHVGGNDDGRALFAVSAMIGTLMLSRVLTETSMSNTLLSAAKRELLALVSCPADVSNVDASSSGSSLRCPST